MIQALSRVACADGFVRRGHVAKTRCIFTEEGFGPSFWRECDGVHPTQTLQVKLLKPDLALALTWWSVSFPSFKQKVVGNTTMNLQKFDDGWKIVASHTSIAEM
jgi:hypothetical protein